MVKLNCDQIKFSKKKRIFFFFAYLHYRLCTLEGSKNSPLRLCHMGSFSDEQTFETKQQFLLSLKEHGQELIFGIFSYHFD